jgi:hypothetical protein
MSTRQHGARVLADKGRLRCNGGLFNFKRTFCLMTPTSYFIPNFEVRSVLLLAALTIGTAFAAHAQTGGAAPAPVQAAPTQAAPTRAAPTAQDINAAFDRADINQDGKLTKQESARFPAVEQRFDQIDSNRDQAVSREEFMAALKS